jgi:hypothetical protein
MKAGTRFTGGSASPATEERRRAVASFDSYAEAERAVDHLSDQGFPVERVAIIGRDLKFVEQVTGRMGYLGAMLRGAFAGSITGLLVGWLFAIFDWVSPAIARGWLIVDGFWFGLLVGALAGLLAHAMTQGRRDFASVRTMTADRYEVVVDEEVAPQAERLLAEMTGADAPSPAGRPNGGPSAHSPAP